MASPEVRATAGGACPACGAENRAIARFCRRCGRDLRDAIDPAATTPARAIEPEPPSIGRSWSELKSVLAFGAMLLAMSAVGMIATKQGEPIGYVETAITIVDASIVAVYAISQRALLIPLFAKPAASTRALRETLLTGAAIGGFAFAYFGILGQLGLDDIDYLAPFDALGWPRWTAFVIISVAPGVVEEIAFRGIILGRLERVLSARDALLIQAALFAVLHLSPFVFVSHFVIGLLLGRLRVRTKSLYPGMLVHMVYNGAIIATELAR